MAQDEFAYNNYVSRSIGKTPFQIVNRIKPKGISYLRDIVGEEKRSVEGEVFANVMKSLHEEVKMKLE